MTTASIYVRLSREAQSSNLSLDGMRQECRALADRHGLQVVSERIDDGQSGAERDRPGFVAWLDDGRSGRAQVLIAPFIDRVGREGAPIAAIVNDLVDGKDTVTGKRIHHPVRILTLDGLDSHDRDAFDMKVTFDALKAKGEHSSITRRNRATRARLIKEGRHVGGKAPYGTRVVEREGGKYLEPDPAEGEVLREVASRILRGDGMRATTRWLNVSGYRTRRGKEWQRSSLKATLLSDASRLHVFDLPTYRQLDARLRPPSKVKGQSDQDRRQQLAERRAALPIGGRPQRWLLSGGRSVCGSCGRKMTISRNARRGHTRYICSSTAGGELCPRIISIDADQVDAHIEEVFLERYGSGHFYEEKVTLIGAADLDAAERAVEDAHAAMVAPGATPDTFAAFQAAQTAFEAAKAKPLEHKVELVATGTYSEQWEAADHAGRAQLIAGALAEPVRIKPGDGAHRKGVQGSTVDLDRLEITWRDQVNPEA